MQPARDDPASYRAVMATIRSNPTSPAVPLVSRPGKGEGLSRTEWLLANGLGGFAMGTVSGMPSRRYHGWLVGSARPPVARVMALSSIAEWLVILPGAAGGMNEQRIDLSSFRFAGATGGVVSPRGLESLQRFEKTGSSARWDYKFGLLRASRELSMLHGQNASVVRYRVRTGGHAARLELRPLVALRDFHGPLMDHHVGLDRYRVTAKPNGCEVAAEGWNLSVTVGGVASGATFQPDPAWWYNFEYVREAERGLDAHEDLFAPGLISVPLPSFPAVSGDDLEHVVDVTASFWADAGIGAGRQRAILGRASDVLDAEERRRAGVVSGTVAAVERRAKRPMTSIDREAVATLASAGDAFIVRRSVLPSAAALSPSRTDAVSVIAGYPWFSDWGRDTMISFRGLFLETGRFAEGRAALDTFARFARAGLIPNNFDDTTGEPQYHTVDASLWFVQAACDYLRTTGDAEGFTGAMHAACVQIIENYRAGTTYGIQMDEDGLIMGGDHGTALTWMDARRDGVVFTPRDGKPVEIQALWYNALLAFADAVDKREPKRARELRQMAARTAESFAKQFWSPERGYLADRVHKVGTQWTADWSVRPNQLFAASLPFPIATPPMRAGVVSCVRSKLLTPMGVRTLDPRDPAYAGRYRGPLFERDRAYHNGTVWPWLIGAYVHAVLRYGADASVLPDALAEARVSITPLLSSVIHGLAAGSLPEIFDGDTPSVDTGGYQRPDGCMAQAWSIAQVLEALSAILAAES